MKCVVSIKKCLTKIVDPENYLFLVGNTAEKIAEKFLILVNCNAMAILYDNARSHNTRVHQEKIMARNMKVLPHPP